VTAPATHPAAQTTRRGRDDRGAVLLLIALVLPVLIVMTAFAVDLGRQRSIRRTMQARADIIALDLARLIDGRTVGQIEADSATEAAVVASAARNEVERSKITYRFGHWVDTGNSGFFEPLADTTMAEAVEVRAQDEIDYFFRPGSGRADRSAVAENQAVATFGVGSKLASVNTSQAQLLNGLLNGALDTNLALSAATYQGLVGSTVNINELASEMGFGSPEEMADANVSAQDLYLASAQVLERDGQTAAASIFESIGAGTDADAVVDMGQVFDFSAGGGRSPATETSIDAFNLLTGSAYAVNGTNTIAIPGVDLNLLNFANTSTSLEVIQKAQFITGPVGTSVSTQQATMALAQTIDTPPTIAGLVRVTGSVTLRQTVAGSTGTLTDIFCGGSPGINVGVAPQPVATTAQLTLSIRTLLGIEVARVNTGLSATPQGQSAGASFDYPTEFLPDVGTGSMVEAPTTPLGLQNLLKVTSADVTVLGILPLPLANLVNGLNLNVLSPLFSTLDQTITGPLSSALGLSIGAADVGAADMTCSSVRLVG
jgi:uncharacterized membrane protein